MNILEVFIKVLLSGVIASLLSRGFYLVHMITIAPFIKKKCLKEQSYHTVEGETSTARANSDEKGYYHFTFIFTENGKKYRMPFRTYDCAYAPTKAYYRKNPRSAVFDLREIGRYEYSWRMFFILYAILLLLFLF